MNCLNGPCGSTGLTEYFERKRRNEVTARDHDDPLARASLTPHLHFRRSFHAL
jgi:hypothetical protein